MKNQIKERETKKMEEKEMSRRADHQMLSEANRFYSYGKVGGGAPSREYNWNIEGYSTGVGSVNPNQDYYIERESMVKRSSPGHSVDRFEQ